MIDEFAKEYLHSDLRDGRATMLWKLEGLAEYDVRRPLTPTGTNLLGLVKHLTITEAWYFGEVFGRPFPERLPWRDDDADERADDAKLAAYFDHKLQLADMWATEDESRGEIVDRYRRMWEHSDATIAALDIDAPGHVAWWPRPDVQLFNILVHVLNETNRHAGHADILREQLDGAVGTEAGGAALHGRDPTFWENHRAHDRAGRRGRGSRPSVKPRYIISPGSLLACLIQDDELLLVEIVVLVDVEVAHLGVLGRLGRFGIERRPAEELQLHVLRVAAERQEPALVLEAVERLVPLHRLVHLRDRAHDEARRGASPRRASTRAWPRCTPAPAPSPSPFGICGLPPERSFGAERFFSAMPRGSYATGDQPAEVAVVVVP